MTETLTSASNPKIKKLLALQQKSAERRESGLFVLEGVRELLHCLSAGYEADSLFVCPGILGDSADARRIRDCVPGNRLFEVTPELYSRIACRGGTEGVVAEMRAKGHSLAALRLPENPLVLVVESVEKPGNLGAMFRSCDASGADAMLICGEGRTDIYNPNLIRASVGAVFTVPCAACGSAEAISFLKSRGIRILTAQLQDSSLYYDCDMRRGTALVMGAEDTGLSDIWSAAVLLYEAVRQRGGTPARG